MGLDTARLIACGVQPTQARIFAPLLEQAFGAFGIDTHRRQAAFLAQTVHESAGFTRLEECLFYSTPERIVAVWPRRISSEQAKRLVRNPQALAAAVYSLRLGNGPPESGDGFRFRGRGCIALTGRANYRQAGTELKMPYEAQPELVGQPADAVLTACWFWTRNDCNRFADAGDHGAMCRIVNGPGMAGLRERTALYRECFEALA